MIDGILQSTYFGLVISIGAYMVGIWLRKKTGFVIFHPLLLSVSFIILFLLVFQMDYGEYNKGASYLSYLLTPATVCLAIPLYKQLDLLKKYKWAILQSLFAGALASVVSVWVLSKVFGLDQVYYVTLLPKSITTAMGIGVSEELGGIVSLTVVAIVITGVVGNVIADGVFRILRIHHPLAKGLSLGCSAHAIGTSKALELGEIEGAMSSLAIVVTGVITIIMIPILVLLPF